jgi:hypothetical protein
MYDELELRIRRGPDDQTFEIDLVQEAADTRSGLLSLAGYRELEPTADAAAMLNYGRDLFDRLFAPPLAEGFTEALARARALKRKLRLRMIFEGRLPNRLHAIPWEMICFDDTGMDADRPLAIEDGIAFSRALKDAKQGTPITRRPIRMLVVVSSPNDLGAWELATFSKEAERLSLDGRFGKFKESGQLHYDFLPVASPEALQEALNSTNAAGQGYDVLLYYGHALHHEEEGSRLVLEDAVTGGVTLYDGTLFVLLLAALGDKRPQLVVLVACNSATISDGPSLNGLASRLMTQSKVPAVIAMQRLVEIALARTFTYYLSEYLLRDGVIDEAVNVARRTVYEAGDPGWSTPVLYMRMADGRLFTANAALDYVQALNNTTDFVRWRGNEYIPIGVIALVPGQDWRLVRYRPEDAPPTINAIEALKEAVGINPPATVLVAKQPTSQATNITAMIGPPHSGQTTTLRRLALDLADAVRRDSTKPLGVYISLAGYEQQHAGDRLEQHIIARASEMSATLGEALRDLFRLRAPDLYVDLQPYIFLFDDFDEVPEGLINPLARELAAMAKRFPSQQFVLACWQELFPTDQFPQARVLLIQPLNERQVANYLRARAPSHDISLMNRIRDNRLLALTSDPNLLVRIYDRLSGDPKAQLTRNQLVQEYLDRALSDVSPRYVLGDTARRSLSALAWYSRWNHIENIPIGEFYQELARVRGQRDYSLEDLFSQLVEAGLLSGVGQHAVRFVHPALHAYCAAVALSSMPEAPARLLDIITMCGDPNRLPWWEDILYALAGLMNNPEPLFRALAFAVRAGSNSHALLIARCLEALPKTQEVRLPNVLRQELIDHCVLAMHPDREPIAERREQIVIALGRMTYPQVITELKRLLVEKIRRSSSGDARYEYTNVRIAAARSLRNIILQHYGSQPTLLGQSLQTLVINNGYNDEISARQNNDELATGTAITELAIADALAAGMAATKLGTDDDTMLMGLLDIWRRGPTGRDALRKLILDSPSVPERAVASFALADLVYPPLDPQANTPPPFMLKMQDAELLLDCIANPPMDGAALQAGWDDTMWAAADALTLFDPDIVISLLKQVLVDPQRKLLDSSAQQLAYLAGRVRAAAPEVIEWLRQTLITHPNPWVKSKALTSLAWMGFDVRRMPFERADGRTGCTLKDLAEDIAAALKIPPTSYGPYTISNRTRDNPAKVYLRRKAIEALAWIGDQQTLSKLEANIVQWPISLREYWYNTAEAIRQRIVRE